MCRDGVDVLGPRVSWDKRDNWVTRASCWLLEQANLLVICNPVTALVRMGAQFCKHDARATIYIPELLACDVHTRHTQHSIPL